MDTEFVPGAFALKDSELEDTTALMFGRRNYEAFAAVWRDSDDHAAYADLPKYVVSTTLGEDGLHDGWGQTAILRSSDEVAELKRGEGGGIFIHGSAELARTLSDARLIDRYNLLVLLGAGKSLFSRGDNDMPRLRESDSCSNGVTKLVYEVAS